MILYFVLIIGDLLTVFFLTGDLRTFQSFECFTKTGCLKQAGLYAFIDNDQIP